MRFMASNLQVSVQAQAISPLDVGVVVAAIGGRLFEAMPESDRYIGMDVLLTIRAEDEEAGSSVTTVELRASYPGAFSGVLPFSNGIADLPHLVDSVRIAAENSGQLVTGVVL